MWSKLELSRVRAKYRPQKGKPMPNKLDITVVVNGQPTIVEANINEPLHVIIPKALEQTGNMGQPPENWELRNEAGSLLDPAKKIEEYRFGPGAKLFLNLKAGVGG